MASTPDSVTGVEWNPAAEQNALLRSILQSNQKICSLLEAMVPSGAQLQRVEHSSSKPDPEESITDIVPLVGRVLLQNDFDLPEFSYSQFLQTSENDSLQFNPRHLPAENYTHEDLRAHVNLRYWTPAVRKLLEPLLSCAPFADYSFMEDVRFHPPYDHLARLLVCVTLESGEIFRTRPPLSPTQSYPWRKSVQECWDDLRTMNRNPRGQGPFVGRVVVLREPGPLKLSALHLVMGKHFDIDSIFAALSTPDPTRAYLHVTEDEYYGKRQRNFIFAFRYFTVVSGSRCPCAWQTFDLEEWQSEGRIPISSCSSVVALSFAGEPVGHVEKVVSGRVRKYPVYDPFAPWQVLVVNFFPDLHTTSDVFTTLPRLINGPEAFLRAVLAQYRDSRKRFAEITSRIVDLTTLGVDFLASEKVRREWFADEGHKTSQRYFWASQVLASANDRIQAMIQTYREQLTDDVWMGTHDTIWPGTQDDGPKYASWRKAMLSIKHDFEVVLAQLEETMKRNIEEQKDISALQTQLLNANAVQDARISVLQGRNIKILTMVSIFFLPLTFATSIFGMTNYPSNSSFTPFAITIVCICLPTYFIIGCLNTSKGMDRAYERLGSLVTNIHLTYAQARAAGSAFMGNFTGRKNPSPPDVALH